MKFSRLPLLLLPILLCLGGCAKPARQPVTKLDDLPRHTYPLQGKAADVVTDRAAYEKLAARVEADIEADLARFDIRDATTLRRLKTTLLAIRLLRGDDAGALRLIAEIRDLETKPAARVLDGIVSEARIKAKREAGLDDAEFRREMEQRLASVPWPVIQAEAKDLKADFEIRSRNLLLGVVESEIEPAAAKTGVLSYDFAERLIGARAFIELSLPLRNEVVDILQRAIDAHRTAKPDIWAARALAFPPGAPLAPVAIGVWDSGVDLALFPGRVARGADRKPLGIAYDLHSNPVPELLYPVPRPERLRAIKGQLKGLLDLQSSLDSPEAAAVRARLGAIRPDEVQPYLEELEMFSNYAHGTHVAGIAVAGNPAARIVTGRITFDYRSIPEAPTVADARKDAAAYRATVGFFRRNGVRVANMSWGGSLKDVEKALEANGVGRDATERARLAREIFDIDRDGLRDALASAPEILFVTAAGNDDNDVAFDEVTPSSFRLPNLLVVGAVDRAGDATSFTSFGANVAVYANGFEVESLIPGGDRMPFSGTSMASPGVANLAAKLLALDPALSAVEVADLIRRGAQASPAPGADPRITLIDPAASLALLKARSKK